MKLLVANFFPAFHPPASGGEQRYYYLYHHLSRWCDVTLLSPTYADRSYELVEFSPRFREHRVPKDAICDRLHWQLSRHGIGPECSAYVVALAGAVETEFGRRFAELVTAADAVIHESPFTLPYDRTIWTDGKPRIYNAYNVEFRLAEQILKGEAGRNAVEFIRFLERTLVEASTLLFATCAEERDQFIDELGALSERVLLAPNGFDSAPSASVRERDGRYALFMGSAHPPNVEAARYIIDQLAPAAMDVEFHIIGSVCKHLAGRLPSNVKCLGLVDEAQKREQLERCAVALNPLSSGAGTNLKMLDYMSAGAPIVSTPIGARGLGLEDGTEAIVVDLGDFRVALARLLDDPRHASSIGQAARHRALADYTWENIALRVHEALVEKLPHEGNVSSRQRPRLLILNDFPLSVGVGGGHTRIRALMRELASTFDITVVTLTDDTQQSRRQVAPGIVEIAIPKTREHRDGELQAGRAWTASIADIVASRYCVSNRLLVETVRAHARDCAAVIFEHPYLAPLAEVIADHLPVVYSSLNVESDLKPGLLAERRDREACVATVEALESSMLARSDLVICVCDADRTRFEERYPQGRYVVIENGTHVGARTEPPSSHAMRQRPLAIFIGSGHLPNVEAARYLIESVAPSLPDVTFGIVGSVCDAVALLPRPTNVALFGVLHEAEKNALLARATVAVNPLFEGGGSSLKVPDFLGAGLPLVSTSVGVRGYPLRDGEHYIAAERDGFAAAVGRLAADRELQKRLAANGHEFASRHLDWRVLGRRYRRELGELVGRREKPRVLVATYRFLETAAGGAEAYLLNVLRELARRDQLVIEVTTCNVDTIADTWHFAATYTRPDRAPAAPRWLDAVHRFDVDIPNLQRFEACRRLFRMWMSETRRQAVDVLQACGEDPLLLGGWNFAERFEGGVRRWTSHASQVYIGKNGEAIRLRGRAPRATRAVVSCGEAFSVERMLDGSFEWTEPLPNAGIVDLQVAEPYIVDDDPRELGIAVEGVDVREAGIWRSLDLTRDFETTMRRNASDKWVGSLIDITEQRARADDDLFVPVRGPHSAEQERWLADNIGRFDVVLVQGTPFSTLVEVTGIATRRRVPVVLLPHFHMEDRYYHWRSYYDAFRRAARVIAAPASSKPAFFDVIGARSVPLPGGGVDPAEYEARDEHRRAFRTLHRSSDPFVLVLGRKTGAKRYSMVVDAIDELKARGHRIDVVLIGPDEDGRKIESRFAYTYGSQPRAMVLGALADALCLVNMSDSESFGIVLLESWLSGRPVIAQARCRAFVDLVVHGENGYLVDNVRDLADAIAAYLRDDALVHRHANAGRAVAERHTWANIAEAIEAVLLDVAGCGHLDPLTLEEADRGADGRPMPSAPEGAAPQRLFAPSVDV